MAVVFLPVVGVTLGLPLVTVAVPFVMGWLVVEPITVEKLLDELVLWVVVVATTLVLLLGADVVLWTLAEVDVAAVLEAESALDEVSRKLPPLVPCTLMLCQSPVRSP